MSGRFGFWPCCGNCNCNAAKGTWRVVITSVTDNASTDCALFNGTHDLTITEQNEVTGDCTATLDLGGSNGEVINLFFSINRLTPGSFFVDGVTLEFTTNDGTIQYLNDGALNHDCLAAFSSVTMNLANPAQTLCDGFSTPLTLSAV